MTLTIATRPSTISGCLQTLSESWEESLLKSKMENGVIKTRRRTTHTPRIANGAFILTRDKYADMVDWFYVRCAQGVHPTRIKMPGSNTEEVWRFSKPPSFEWDRSAKAFLVSIQIEQLPEWVGL